MPNPTSTVITQPAAEPVTLAEARTQTRVDQTTEDSYLTALITVARQLTENATSRSLISQTRSLVLDGFPPCIHLPHGPVQSVTSIIYIDSAGASQTLPGALYQTDLTSVIPRIVVAPGQSWPTVQTQRLNPVTVRYVAGFGSAGADVPSPLRQAMLLLISHLYDQRAQTSVVELYDTPFGYDALIASYKLDWF